MTYRILCIVPSLAQNLNPETIRSILNQTYPIEMLAILPKKINKPTINDRITQVLNDGLANINLESFDYLLRIDGDVTISSNFIEENLKADADCCGKSGYAMLIKVSTFLRLMNGRFSKISDDTYLGLKFMKEGAKVVNLRAHAEHSSTTAHPLSDYILRGKTLYKVGYEPVHMIHECLLHVHYITLKDCFTVLTYFGSVIKRIPKSDVAGYVFNYQVKRLFRLRNLT